MANTSRGMRTAGEMYGPALVPTSRMRRTMRRPQHTFNVKQPPWGIQPICCAPVLPGESLKGFTFQARAVLDPIKSPLIGWWLEYYIFYVKHRDLKISTALQDMVLNPGSDQSASYGSAQSTLTYHNAGATTFNFTLECLKVVTEEYFRFGDDDWDDYLIDTSWPAAQVQIPGWMDSIIKASDMTTEDPVIALTGNAQNLAASEIETLMTQWALLRSQGVIGDISYEDFLRSYGIRQPQQEELGRPELIRYVKEWSYPTNTVEPTTGVPTSAVSWAIAERGDKDRFFKEPGFIFACSVVRPKVYTAHQTYSAVHWLNDAYLWLPAVLSDDPRTSSKVYSAATGPISTADIGYVVDYRDLFLYGDQFTNWTVGGSPSDNVNHVLMPVEASLERRFATTTIADNLFKTTGTRYLRQDGVFSFNIAGRVVDLTPGTGL